MKKDMKKLILIFSIILIVTITGCSVIKNEAVQPDSSGEIEPVEETNTVEKPKENLSDNKSGSNSNNDNDNDSVFDSSNDSNEGTRPEMDTFLKMLTPNTTAADLKGYIEENIQYVSSEEAEKMLEFLLIYQTETIADFEITEEFFNEVYDDMDESVLESIQDEELKADYKLLLDSSLMVKFSEGHPYLRTDWKSLKKFSPYLPKGYEEIFDLYVKIDNYDYNYDELDVISPGIDIIETETIEMNGTSSFFKKTINDLYRFQVSDLLFGPEGSNMDFWSDRNSNEYIQLIELSSHYPESMFSKIINELELTYTEEIGDITGIIQKYLTFGLDSENYLERLSYNEGMGEYDIIQVKFPDDKQKEDKINSAIEMAMDSYIEEENIDGDFFVRLDLIYADEEYISYEMLLEYTDSQGDDDYKYLYRTLDYSQDKHITLEEYLGASFESIKLDLERVLGEKLDSCPEFILYSDDISLFSYNQEGGTDHIGSLNLKDLVPYRKN